MKRIVLFLATNFGILIVLSLSMRLLGVEPYLSTQGLNINSLLIYALIFGFGGSFISLAISKWMAKTSMGVKVITDPQNADERWLFNTIQDYAQKAGIKMPEVGIYDSQDVNAFATGMTKNSSLVAVSSGLLQQMSREEAKAVIGHEVAHAANGDMVTLTLIQGVVNTFVIFASRIIGNLVDGFLRRGDNNNSGPGPAFYITMVIAELVLGVIASIIVMWFSRQREFSADIGGAKLAGRNNMVSALQKLKDLQDNSRLQPLPDKMAAFGITGGKGFISLFTTHPPLEDRITALKSQNIN